MAWCGCNQSLFGSNKFIKFSNSDLVAIEGANTIERQFLSYINIPYSQVLRGRVLLKKGQVDYLLNNLGLGDGVTFLSIAASYDTQSKVAEDNYVVYNFSDDMTKNHYFAQVMVLTGTSTSRIKQLYLTNPNANYDVNLDVLVAVIDDTYNPFTDTINQSGLSFTNLHVTDIHTHVVNESIVIIDSSDKPLIYIKIANIISIERSGLILVVDDQSYGTLFLKFVTQFDADQAFSLLNYVLDNPGVDIDTINPLDDVIKPVVYFLSRVDNTGDYISFNGMTNSVPYNTSQGLTFSTSISLSDYGTQSGSVIDGDMLVYLLVDKVTDNRDGTMSLAGSNLVINGTSSTVTNILTTGTYSVTFDFSDLAQNYLQGVNISLNIVS